MRTSLRAGVAAMTLILAGCEQRAAEPAANEASNASAAEAPSNQAPLALAAADPAVQWGPCPEGMPEGCGISVLRGDPSKPDADIFLRIPGGSAIPPHTHSSAERMILVAGEMAVKYQGAPESLLRAGHYAFGPAKLPHRAECRSSEPCILFIAFEEPVDLHPFEGSLD